MDLRCPVKISTRSAGLILAILFVACCDAPWSGPPDWNQAFPQDRIGEWKISVSEENWLRLIADPHSLPCTGEGRGPDCSADAECPLGCDCVDGLCVTDYIEAELEVDGQKFSQVGLSITGDRRAEKENFRIRFDLFRPEQRYFDLGRVNLRSGRQDPTLIREKLALELFRSAGVCAPRAAFAWVIVNEEPRGLYTLVQQVDRKLLEDCFGEDWGNLYRLRPGADLAWQGEDLTAWWPPFSAVYQKVTNEGSSDVSDLLSLMKILSGEVEPELEKALYLDEFLRAQAVNSWLSNLDSYAGTGDNLYLYHDAAGRFRYIPWDLSKAFGNYHGLACSFSTDEMLALSPFSPTCGDARPLIDRTLEVESYKKRYQDIIGKLLLEVLEPQRVFSRAVFWHAFVRERAYADRRKGFSDAEFEETLYRDIPANDNPARVPGLEKFVFFRDNVFRNLIE